MAWTALVAALLFPLLVLWTESDQLGAVAGAFYVFVSAVVGSYIGFATWDDANFKNQPPTGEPDAHKDSQ